MKVKLNMSDFSGKSITKFVSIPNKDHLEVQKNTRMQIHKNRKKYNRKIKHKSKLDFFIHFLLY